jgi:hypothetical protein
MKSTGDIGRNPSVDSPRWRHLDYLSSYQLIVSLFVAIEPEKLLRCEESTLLGHSPCPFLEGLNKPHAGWLKGLHPHSFGKLRTGSNLPPSRGKELGSLLWGGFG